MSNLFTPALLHWHHTENRREMPWKGEKDPYKIWLSEVILQQTRVEQGMAYYERFIQNYPTLQSLAAAPDQAVFKLWEGLGYYSRCRNLLATARYLVAHNHGSFPRNYSELLLLKGIGPYTAAAIASFAFNEPHAVVDGNVFRVLSRYLGMDTPIDSTAGKKLFTEQAQLMLDKKAPGIYNQAIMDFGATVCKPATPLCTQCVLQSSCKAFATGMVNQLPVKEKTLTRRLRWFTYFILECKGKVFVHQRRGRDIWQDLFEFYLVESEKMEPWSDAAIHTWLEQQLGATKATIVYRSELFTQALTHQQIGGRFIHIQLAQIPPSLRKNQWVSPVERARLAFPKFITQYLKEKS